MWTTIGRLTSPFFPSTKSQQFLRLMHLHRDSDKELFSFTSGRWLYNHEKQLAVRYIPFNVNALAAVASDVSGGACTSLTKMHEGRFSRVFLLKTDNNREFIARIPFPVFGPPDLTIASEVATMDFIRTEARQVNVPIVLAWSSSNVEGIGVPYLMYEKVQGTALSALWDKEDFTDQSLSEIVMQCMKQQAQTSGRVFSQIGSIFYKDDVSADLQTRPLYDTSITPATPNSDRFRIGPSLRPEFYRGGRSQLDIDRGPWMNMQDYAQALSNCERTWILKAPEGVKEPDELLKTLSDFDTLIPYLYPDANIGYVLSHPDLHADNVLVDTSGPRWKVTWLDWQGASVLPFFDILDVPPMFDYSTTSPLVNYDPRKPAEKPVYAEGYHSDSIGVDDKVLAQKAYMEAYRHWVFLSSHAKFNTSWFKMRSSREMYDISKELLVTMSSGSIEGPEAARWSMIKAVWNWDSLPCVPVYDDGKASAPCPVQYSLEEQDIWEKRFAEALRVTLLQTTYTRQVGLAENSDGLVIGTEADFKQKKDAAEKLYKELIAFAQSNEERSWYENNWPFQDGRLSLNALSCI
ncbi:hypothetical protein BDN71DRAFT_1449360 [Pleurotus eryngii]|uniref:Aminoglycoside phosphotransferase domain-containing protein n=1 Tax=Pleurotus eryngii TaxID=5323 RepID=A0A9P5ZXN6_PLEER|nr:hypothetical protein BDN71DRAFT_1449360 [Pleurotus eryngii]